MALVSLEQGKAHLKVRTDDENDLIDQEIEQASAIVLNYLKWPSVHHLVAIETSSVASPTVVTMDTAHGFKNGETVVITGHVDSVPTINGTHVISNVTEDTYTIPVAVTTAGTGGTAAVQWTADDVPSVVQTAVKLMLAHLHEHRGDDMDADEKLWNAISLLLMRLRDPALA
jgi:hypothetical protein